MRNFLNKSIPGLLAIVMVAGLGYFVLTPPSPPVVQAAAIEIASHTDKCAVCRLPLYGRGDMSSKLGPDSHVHESVKNAMQ